MAALYLLSVLHLWRRVEDNCFVASVPFSMSESAVIELVTLVFGGVRFVSVVIEWGWWRSG